MNEIPGNITQNIQDNIPKSLNFKDILASLKKILWLFIIAFIAFNVALFYFLNWLIYFVGIIIWNVVFVWLCIPIMIFIGKSVLIDRGMEAAEEVKSKFTTDWNIDKEKVIKVVKKNVQ